MQIREYLKMTAFEIRHAVLAGELDPAEVFECAVELAHRINPKINAIVTFAVDEGRKLLDSLKQKLSKKESELLLAGVPLLLKDLEQAWEGVRMTDGSKLLLNYIPNYTCEFVSRIIEQGGVIFGKTNTSEFGLLGYTEPDAFGHTANPWDFELNPGGSSGGSASAVASCTVPVATGSDGGGSIRIPSAYTGLVGLKPSRGRTPSGPPWGELWQGFALNFFFTRSVKDCALCLDAVAGAGDSSPFRIAEPTERYLEAVEREPKKLKVAFTTESPLGTRVEKLYKDTVLAVAREFEKLGWEVEEDKPDGWGWDIFYIFISMYYSEVCALVEFLRENFGDRVFREVEATTLSLYTMGRAFGAGEWIRASWRRYELTYNLNMFFKKYDIFLTPTVAFLPPKKGELKPSAFEQLLMRISARMNLGWLIRRVKFLREFVRKLEVENFQRTPFTQYANITGVPAMSLPFFTDGSKVPSAFQIIAPFGREDLLLQVARVWEKIHGWHDRFPPPSVRKLIGGDGHES